MRLSFDPAHRIHGKGWRPDLPDERDEPYRVGNTLGKFATAFANDAGRVAPAHRLRQHAEPVRDQGNAGSCTGYSGCAGVGILRRTDEDDLSTVYSPRYAYFRAREYDFCETADVGAYLRDMVKGLANWGVPPESSWRYSDELKMIAKRPTQTADKAAKRWKLGTYHRCGDEHGQNMLLDVKTAIAAGSPVVFGFVCYESMFTPAVHRSGVIPMPSGREDFFGGHAVCAVGYDDDTQLIEFQNSWGTGWGDAGFGYLPYEYVENRNLSDDFWALTKEA